MWKDLAEFPNDTTTVGIFVTDRDVGFGKRMAVSKSVFLSCNRDGVEHTAMGVPVVIPCPILWTDLPPTQADIIGGLLKKAEAKG